MGKNQLLTVQMAWDRLEAIDQQLEHAVAPRKIGKLAAQRRWFAKELSYALRREAYPDSPG
jgi:hypothetical protein